MIWAIVCLVLFIFGLYCEIRKNTPDNRTIFQLIFDRFVVLPTLLAISICYYFQENYLIVLTCRTYICLATFSATWVIIYKAIKEKHISKMNIFLIILYIFLFTASLLIPLRFA